MSKPATTRVKPIDGKKEWHETCVWAGPAYSSRELPKPKDPKVYFNVMKRIVVYVRCCLNHAKGDLIFQAFLDIFKHFF